MKKTVAVVGNSQLSFFVARQLDELLGSHAHIEIIWVATTDQIFPVANAPVKYKEYLNSCKVVNSIVRSVSLRDSRIITGKRLIEYDVAFIDQTPVYTAAERENITDQLETLIATVRSNENRGVASKAKITFLSSDFDSLGLALSLNDRKNRDSSASVANIRVEVNEVRGSLVEFLRNQGISTRKSQFPGLILKGPLPIISSKKIRGLRVDLSGRAMVLTTLEPINHQNIFILDNPDRKAQNIARSDWQLAKQIATNMLAKIDGGLEKPVDDSGSKLLLKAASGQFISLGSMNSTRNRAKALYLLDKRFWNKLFR